MITNEALVTIVIPSYNHELYIEQCIIEVLKIDIKKNIIIIDDGSSDNTPIIIKNFITKQSFPIEFIQKKNSGLVKSLNLAISKVTTKYVYLIASDDLVNPIGFSKCMDTLISSPSLKFLIGGSENLFTDGSTNNTYRNSHEKFFKYENKILRKKLFFDYPKPLLLQSTIFKTEIIRDVGNWDEDVTLDDYSMFIKLFLKYNQHSDYIFKPNYLLCKYRIHESNSSKNYVRQYSMVKQVIIKYAPSSLKSKAIGYRLGFYIMLCIREKKISILKNLLLNSNLYELFWSITSIPITYYKYKTKSL